MNLVISQKVREKLAGKTPPVSEGEIRECFGNVLGKYLKDVRENNRTDPPTLWFIAQTDVGRILKVAFILFTQDKQVVIKTAYEPNDEEKRIYKKYGGPIA
jgi:hypothetical protein